MKRTIQYEKDFSTSDQVKAQDEAFDDAKKQWPRAESIKTTIVRTGYGRSIVRIVVTLDNA